jgi:cell division protein FtsQ
VDPGRPAGPAGLSRVFGGLSVVLVGVLGLCLFLTTPLFGVKDILVIGSVHLTSEEIVALCDVTRGTNIFKVPTTDIRERLLALPRVSEATVSRRLPGRLVVEVVEREGVLLLPCQEEFVEVDATGHPVELHRFIGALGLPVLTGVRIEGVTLGSRISDERVSLGLCCAAALGVQGRLAVSEIHVDDKGELTLYTLEGIPVYLGPATALDAKVEAFMSILPDLPSVEFDVAYIDVRYPRHPVVGSTETVFQSGQWPGEDPDTLLLGGP